jgi:hypothetical protein
MIILFYLVVAIAGALFVSGILLSMVVNNTISQTTAQLLGLGFVVMFIIAMVGRVGLERTNPGANRRDAGRLLSVAAILALIAGASKYRNRAKKR